MVSTKIDSAQIDEMIDLQLILGLQTSDLA